MGALQCACACMERNSRTQRYRVPEHVLLQFVVNACAVADPFRPKRLYNVPTLLGVVDLRKMHRELQPVLSGERCGEEMLSV